MNTIYKILFVIGFCIAIASCSHNSTTETSINDYATQYTTDLAAIDDYIDTHYMTFDANYNVAFDTILPTTSHLSIRNDTAFQLQDTTVAEDGINYKVYFIKFREGGTLANPGKRPTQVDSVHVSYRGSLLRGTNKQFDIAETPVWFKLQEVVTGWAHIIPNFKTGSYTAASGTTPASFSDFGAGVMFLPSGLAYYNYGAGTIPAYAPIIFSFKLYELQYRDQDGDGIKSKDERKLDPAISPLIRWKENPYLSLDYHEDSNGLYDVVFLDTDGDGVANMYDVDDDGDNYLTKAETQKLPADITPASPLAHYPFNPTSTEPKGIPACGNIDFTSPTRLRKHLDPSCH
ncbi:hypothetical protein OX283_011495 [Flavobacterium sp. SUN052]|uniref:FKBP-type peptidyl-prolyl cis-trans isomerase n=1 Tax=Flavobacterium sp. SUN052 TaxID=3002441 RepID=UPI00237E7EFC|nr:hypothetical protein [Flavobacterium sp. SUN052]MEC4005281.1 hypothetical protein [Flavobacterium sp. SUN052]